MKKLQIAQPVGHAKVLEDGGSNANLVSLGMSEDKRDVFQNFLTSASLLSMSSAKSKRNPDGDWLNTLLGFIWPQLTVVMQHAMDNLVEPAIRKEVPQLKEGFDIITMMGQKPPTLGPIYSFADDETCDSISIEMGIDWEADMFVKIIARIIEVKVDSIKINGTIVAKLCPLLNEIPLVGAVQIFFLEPPKVDFRVRVKYSPIPLTNIIHSVADKAIRDAIVLPNRIWAPVAMAHQLPSLRLVHNPRPLGVFKLTLLAMRHLPIADYSLIGAGSSDPFAEVSLGAQNWTSDMVSRSLNPVWKKGNSTQFMFYTSHQKISFKVWDYDLTSGNDLLGELCNLTVDSVKGEKWFDMLIAPEFDESKKDPVSGEKQCFVCNETNWSKKGKNPVGTKPRESAVQENRAGKAQVRLLGQILHLGDRATRIEDGHNTLFEIAVTGIRPANAATEPCAGQICTVTFNGEDRSTMPSLLNKYSDPVFIANGIDPMVVFRLGQIHSPQNVADILEIPCSQVKACLRAGHSALWCHSFYYIVNDVSGNIVFKIGDQKATVPIEKPHSHLGWERTINNLEIGPYIIEVSMNLTAFSTKRMHKKQPAKVG